MKKIATSMILACANLSLLCIGYLDDWTHFLGHLPSVISILPLVIAFVVIPFLLLATIVFAIKDFFRTTGRWQAVCALILSLPIGIIYRHPY